MHPNLFLRFLFLILLVSNLYIPHFGTFCNNETYSTRFLKTTVVQLI